MTPFLAKNEMTPRIKLSTIVTGCALLRDGHKDHPSLNLSMCAYRHPGACRRPGTYRRSGAEGIHGPPEKRIAALEGRTVMDALRHRSQEPRMLGDSQLGLVEELRATGKGVWGGYEGCDGD